jgi:hypothetical protein
MNPRIAIRLDQLGTDLRIAAYVYSASGSIDKLVSRFDLIQDAPIIVGSLGDLRVVDAIRGFRAIQPGISITFTAEPEAINALEHSMPGRYMRVATAAADAIAA